jgi:membrane-associated phospholipid phosphatase
MYSSFDSSLSWTNLFKYSGIYAPTILHILSLFLLRNKINYLSFYVIGSILNVILNIILKLSFKEPRPKKNARIIEIAIENKYDFDFNKYGMPSGHAQQCAFSLAFITLVLNNPFITSIYLGITLITLLQRYAYLDHSILQLIVGFCIGIGVGYLFYTICSKYIRGNIKMRPDDFAPR